VRSVLVDAGALIARVDEADVHHHQCLAALKQIRGPLSTVMPAVTEAMHLLGDVPGGPEILCDILAEGAVQLLHVDVTDMPRIKQLMQKYRDRPMDFADAVLVRVAEREGLTRIVTFDDDFRIYRLPRRARFIVLPS
jgi:predicted nucleic acid-binding protein